MATKTLSYSCPATGHLEASLLQMGCGDCVPQPNAEGVPMRTWHLTIEMDCQELTYYEPVEVLPEALGLTLVAGVLLGLVLATARTR